MVKRISKFYPIAVIRGLKANLADVVAVVKLIKVECITKDVFDYALSDEVQHEPNAKLFLLVKVTRRTHGLYTRFWLVDSPSRIRPVRIISHSCNLPIIGWRSYLLQQNGSNIGADEHKAIVDAIKRFPEE